MHFEYFPTILDCLEGVQNDKQEVQTDPGLAGGPVRAAAVKCGIHCGRVTFQYSIIRNDLLINTV